MDVLSLEHNFGREIETSIQQLFTFFCNNISLGQWQLAKACLKQLYLNKKSFKFDLDEIIHDVVANPQVYM
jgi:zinc finger FYVE domain-containing protein 26